MKRLVSLKPAGSQRRPAATLFCVGLFGLLLLLLAGWFSFGPTSANARRAAAASYNPDRLAGQGTKTGRTCHPSLAADARTVVAMLRYVLEPEVGLPMTPSVTQTQIWHTGIDLPTNAVSTGPRV